MRPKRLARSSARRRLLLMTLCGLAIGCLLSFDMAADAHVGATGIVKQRMDLMKSLGRSVKTLSDMFRQKTAYDRALIVSRSREISADGRALLKLFPANSIDGPSEATEAIWRDWTAFERLVGRLVAESNRLTVIAQRSSAWHAEQQFGRVANVCTECHTQFRAARPRTASR